MSRLHISEDEWYPVYVPRDEPDYATWDPQYDVTEKLMARWKVCKKEFDELQDEFHAIVQARADAEYSRLPPPPFDWPKSVATPEIKAKLDAMPMKEYVP